MTKMSTAVPVRRGRKDHIARHHTFEGVNDL